MAHSILETLRAGKPSVGSWLNLGSPLAAEVMASVGYAWLAVDTEHTAYDMDLTVHTFRAIEARGAVPIARAWDHSKETISRLLDAGAWGLVFPHVSTPEQAEFLAKSMRYPPQGTRSIGTSRCRLYDPNYPEIANDQVLCIPQIEDMEGIENAEAIASVDGVDIGFLGPGDLAMSMGVAPGHADHEAALQRFREGCQRVGKPSGIPLGDGVSARQRIAEGFQFIDVSNDFRMLELMSKQMLDEALS